MMNGLRLAFALASAILLVNCDETCPAGYLYRNHMCIGAAAGTGGSTSQGGASAQPDSGAPDASGASGGDCGDSTFGDVCMSASDCGCDTAYCAGYPGSQGICSHTGCLEDPSVCPANWNCGDFSAFQDGLSLCTPP